MFGSAKKDKEKKSSTGDGGNSAAAAAAVGADGGGSGAAADGAGAAAASSSASGAASGSSGDKKKKDKKDKPKLKLIKHKHHHASGDGDGAAGAGSGSGKRKSESSSEEPAAPPIFGVPLEVATERGRSHDGVPLPAVVRQCIDYVEEQGLMQEGIYRSSGVKSKVNKLRNAFNTSRAPVELMDYEPAVVASVLKQFLRELPDPVLTKELMPRFERVSEDPTPRGRAEGMKKLVSELPDCNRALLNWVFAHMMHVIERERFNKMTLQNVSIVLSPTMQISHRVLNCLFENRQVLFGTVQLKKYVPPITVGGGGALPESPAEIEEEIRKQESLLSDLHLQMSSGAATRKVEEQAWEQQRIVTQLKRRLRMAKHNSEGQLNLGGGVSTGDDGSAAGKPRFEPIEYEEELNFSLQTPKKQEAVVAKEDKKEEAPAKKEQSPEKDVQKQQQQESQRSHQEKEREHHLQQQQQQPLRPEKESPPEEKDTEHKVTVMVHQSDVVDGARKKAPTAAPAAAPAPKDTPAAAAATDAKGHVTVIKLQQQEQPDSKQITKQEAAATPPSKEGSPKESKSNSNAAAAAAAPSASVSFKEEAPLAASAAKKDSSSSSFPLLPPPPASHKMRQGNAVLLRPTPASPMHAKPQQQQQQQQQHFHSSLSVDRGVDLAKSKSLPRGLPSDGSAFDMFAAEEENGAGASMPPQQQQQPATKVAAGPQSLNPFPAGTTAKEDAARRGREERRARGRKDFWNSLFGLI